MITIKIKNAQELIERNKGLLVARAIALAGKSERTVDNVVAEEIQKSFEEKGIEADITVAAEG